MMIVHETAGGRGKEAGRLFEEVVEYAKSQNIGRKLQGHRAGVDVVGKRLCGEAFTEDELHNCKVSSDRYQARD